MIQTSFKKENKIKTENRQDILKQKNKSIFYALPSILPPLDWTRTLLPLVLVWCSSPLNANVTFMFQVIQSV